MNFGATWYPPCRKEMPDLESLYKHFQEQGLVILAISDEDASKVKPFIAAQEISYTVLLDPGRKVNTLFHTMGIPKTFNYDRNGKLVACNPTPPAGGWQGTVVFERSDTETAELVCQGNMPPKWSILNRHGAGTSLTLIH